MAFVICKTCGPNRESREIPVEQGHAQATMVAGMDTAVHKREFAKTEAGAGNEHAPCQTGEGTQGSRHLAGVGLSQ